MNHVVAKATSLMKSKRQSLLFHSQHVMRLANYVVERAPGLTNGYTREDILLGALLHDIGKIEWSDRWFAAPWGELSESDIEQMRLHPIRSAILATQLGVPENIITLIIEHHERNNARGYPNGIAPNPASLLIATCDVYAACRETRPYRPSPLTVEQALTEAEKVGCRLAADALRNLFIERKNVSLCANSSSLY